MQFEEGEVRGRKRGEKYRKENRFLNRIEGAEGWKGKLG